MESVVKNSEINDNLKPMAYELLAIDNFQDKQLEIGIQHCQKILDQYPATYEEKMALFNLVIVAINSLNDTELASKYLSTMKQKYPTDELTFLAREAMGEKINWALMKPEIDAKPVEILLPEKYALQNNYPNPFNPMTTIRYDLPQESRVSLIVYDITGREVIRLVDTSQPAGFYHVTWDGKANNGQLVSSGLYLYRIQAINSAESETANFSETGKMIFIR